MLDEFILRALLAGIGVAMIAGVLGCFVVWRRMAYFGDSLAHSALLGIALGFITGISTQLSTIIFATVFALTLLWLQQKKILANDTLLGILAHGALSIGMVMISLIDQRLDLHAYLFGDILLVSWQDIQWIFAGGAAILIILFLYWQKLVLMTIQEELARAEGVKVFLMQLLLMLSMSLMVAVSIQVVGILLITSLLIIPAATARQIVRTPEMMGICAAFFAILAVILGVFGSYQLDTPSGPSIVATSVLLFVIILPFGAWLAKR